ncbi:hypothetical protein L6452_16590 [Arctium lappa]|uniref:Uncharacterized protein n=1 Tax=Arctium lappa TaxID=4217 RepID=A0ACB9C0X3_ARCLA|nr:hypothetical protein L6452_16590 [Arctium lappa]
MPSNAIIFAQFCRFGPDFMKLRLWDGRDGSSLPRCSSMGRTVWHVNFWVDNHGLQKHSGLVLSTNDGLLFLQRGKIVQQKERNSLHGMIFLLLFTYCSICFCLLAARFLVTFDFNAK